MTPSAILRRIAQAAPGPARFSLVVMQDHIGDVEATAARVDSPRAVALQTPAGWIETDPQHLRPGD